MPCGRALVTRDAHPCPAAMRAAADSGVRWVPPGDAHALAFAVQELAAQPRRLVDPAAFALASFRRWLGNDRVGRELDAVLDRLGVGPRDPAHGMPDS